MGNFVQASVSGIPLVLVVMGLVEYFKRLGVKANALLVVSMVIGLVLGGGYQVATLTVPLATFAVWFGIVLYGLALGLVASGIYDVADTMLGKLAPPPISAETVATLQPPAK